ncbi:MAG: hypothetical protein IJW55_08645 [Clostridia bacterium]|nr:hypothetical protein [Clostridia bacterium]
MHFTDNQKRYRILEEISAPADGRGDSIPTRRVLYRANRKRRYCDDPSDGCGAALESKDTIPIQPIYDYINGTLMRIIIYKKRFICQNPNCNKVYTVSNPIEINKGERARDAAIKLVTDKTATMQELAKQGGFSKATGSAATSALILQLDGEADLVTRRYQEYEQRVNALRKLIKSFCLKSNLLYIPFKYRKQWRCLVCSCDFIENECFLLDILESDELKLIEEFTDRITNKAIVKEVHCNANEEVFVFMKKAFSNVDILIPRRCMLDALSRYYHEMRQQNVAISESAYQRMRPIIRYQNAQTWDAKWKMWIDSLDCEQQRFFEPVNDFIVRNHDMINDSFEYEFEASFIELLNEIKNMQRNSFELMRVRLLFANHSHFDKSYETELANAVKYIRAPLPKTPIHNFGVRIFDLVAELRAERERFEINS